MGAKQGTPAERLWRRVNKTDTCWLWEGYVRKDGYGVINVGGVSTPTHRLAWSLTNGEIPKGVHIDHTCYETLCTKPSHLRAVTPKQNIENRSKVNRNSASGVRGVYWEKRANKWCARVRHKRTSHFVGYFTELHEADAACKAKRNELFTHNDLDRA